MASKPEGGEESQNVEEEKDVKVEGEGGTKKRKGSKKKGKSKSSSKSKKGSKGKTKGKKGKKGKKKKDLSSGNRISSSEATEPTESKPKYTEDDVKEYLRRKEAKKKKIREQRLVSRMKQIICVVRTTDPRWNAWTEAPLYEFIRNPNVTVVTVYFKKTHKKEVEKKLMWAEDEEDVKEEELEIEELKEVQPAEDSIPKDFFESAKPLAAEVKPVPLGPYSITDDEIEDLPLGPPPPYEEGSTRLMVINDVVANDSPNMFYFVKTKEVTLTKDNFHDICLFGNIAGGYLSSLHSLMTYVVTPIFLEPQVVPESIKNDFNANLDKFMSSVTETHHRMLAQTVLYVPKEALMAPIDIASKDKDLCSRLETSMVHWIRQIKEVLNNHSIQDSEDGAGPLDEIAFWETRCKDLSGLSDQLRSSPVRTVKEIMTIIKSPFVSQFITASAEILSASAESISNLHYLSVLFAPCQKLHELKVKEIPDQLTNILWLVRVIWKNSPYYNTRERINGLLRRVSNEIIKHCIAEIEVDKVFTGYIDSSQAVIQDCLDCVLYWKKKYFETQKMHHMFSNMSWLLEYEQIFSHIDAFVHRLQDLLEICVCQRLYSRRSEGTGLPLPLYPGIKAPEITRIMEEVQRIFERQLRILFNYRNLILEVKSTHWHEHITKFRGYIKDMEMMVQNVLLSSFEAVSNLEQGIQILETFYTYYKRDIITRVYDKLVVKLYKIMEDETTLVRTLYSKNILPLPLVYPQYAGRGAWALYMKRRLDMQLELLAEAWWLPECGYGDDIREQAKMLSKVLEDFSENMYADWVKQLGTKDLTPKLEIPLMIRSSYKAGMLEVNFDKTVYKQNIEGEIWARLGKEIPEVLQGVYQESERLHNLRETVLLVVKDYNRIVSALSSEERNLFKERIKMLDTKVFPGLTRLTWASDVSDSYINDCRMTATRVQGFTNDYKNANIKIGKLAMKISGHLMVRTDPKRLFEKLEFSDFQKRHREKTILKIANEYKNITMILRSVFEMFKTDGPDVKNQWVKYLETIDTVVEEALTINFRRSLEVLNRAVHGDMRGPPPSIFKQYVILNKNKLGFNPSIPQVQDMILGIFGRICHILKPFPRVIQFLSDRAAKILPFSFVCANDEEAKRTQEGIAEGLQVCIDEVEKYLKTWEPYRDVWEVDKDAFMSHYEAANPAVKSFDIDIARYIDVSNNIQGQESIVNVGFCILDCTTLKDTISDHCFLWQERLSNLLYDRASTKINSIYKYISENLVKFKEPTSLPQLVSTYRKFKEVQADAPIVEKEFPRMYEQFGVLNKYEFDLGEYTRQRVNNFAAEWHHYLMSLKDIDLMLKQAREKLRKLFLAKAELFRQRVQELLNSFRNDGPYTGAVDSETAVDQLQGYRNTMNQLKVQEKELLESLAIFEIDMAQNMDLMNFEKDLEVLESVWIVVYEWDGYWEDYKVEPFRTMQTGDMEDVATHIHKKLIKLSQEHEKKKWEIIDFTKQRLEVFKRSIPVIHEIKNTAIRDRHWELIFETIGRRFDPEDPKFTFEVIVTYGIEKYAEEIGEIVSTAQKELVVENTMKAIREIWTEAVLDMTPYKEKGHYRLKSVQDLIQNLEDHTVSISAMKGSRFAKPFETEILHWEKTLSTINDVLDAFLNVQRQWMYLENIFCGDDIRKQLPKESRQIDEINLEWADITTTMTEDKYVIAATHRDYLVPVLKDLADRLEIILKSLEIFLEAKRQAFPRFYFISNDDLLEILGNSKNPEMVQPHLKKLFDNVHKIKLTKVPHSMKYECHGMMSGDGEYVEFVKSFVIDGPVEAWLTDVETNMRTNLKHWLIKTREDLRKNLNRRDKWIKEWPGQTGITSAQIQWTVGVTRALFAGGDVRTRKNPLKKVKKKLTKILTKYSLAIRGSLVKIQRLKVTAMVTIEIHARDVTEKMYKSDCRDLNSFDWLQQLRFYWDKEENDCMIRQTNTFFNYGYEYLGNSGRLVVTPLTDRCYVTLTTALFLHRGGSPKGPAGTGKTETTKDLGKNLGFYVIVNNCSEGLDYKSMGKMFSGLAQTGAWGCFDEFNRINIEVLSVVAQQIMCILQALCTNTTKFFFEGYEIRLIWSCGIFITMNPGYAGRTELPDNLKAMFRPISMIVPDTSLIAEIVLFGEGFSDTRVLARKVDTLYNLAKQQLSKQDHYDFGLRSMVALLRYAGQKRRQSETMTDAEVLILAMRDMNIPRLTTDDVPLFNGVIKDLFPNDEPPTFDYGILLSTIRNELLTGGYQATHKAILKVLELYETKNSRHSVMLVGRTGSGKSVSWKILRDSLTTLAREGEAGYVGVKEFAINPKALNLAELYGEFDMSTGEWSDGVISSIMRQTCVDEKPDQKWILFDGPVDAVWIENMNSVMDDNKILTLINSERISMPEQVTLLFEVDNLAQASPATVSRCGMVYADYRDLGWKPFILSWLGKQKPRVNKEYQKNVDMYLETTLHFKAASCKELIPTTELNLVTSLSRLMDCLAVRENGVNPKDDNTFDIMVRYYFMFSLIWSVCCTVDEDGRKKIDAFLRELDPIFPAKDTIYDYFVDPKSKNLIHWDTMLSANWKYDVEIPFFKIIVPTVDTVRYNFVLSNLLKNANPVLMVGPVGTGKTSVVQSALTALSPQSYSVLTINMSSQTTSLNVQNFIESRLERRAKGVFSPPGAKNLITFMDDLNMPAKDTYGSQPPLELVRQWLDYRFWYDRLNQSTKFISNMFLVAAMGPPGGGRTVISPRLQSCFSLINMTFPDEPQIKRIFCSLLNQKLSTFEPEVKSLADPITNATIDLFVSVQAKMLPTPSKIHYLFNLRDISKVFQGLLRADKKNQDTKILFSKLWFHECVRVFHDRLVDEHDREWFLTCLSERLGSHLDQTLQSVCPNRLIPIFGTFLNGLGVYEDMRDIKALRKYIEETALPAYNNTPGCVPMNLVLFREAMEHVARISRVISQPKGNMLIVGIGGHGRSSLSRLAISICGFYIFEIEVNKRYRKAEFREDIKKLYRRTGCDNKACCFIMSDTQIVDECFLEDMNNVLSSGEVPNLYKPDEFEDIKTIVTKSALRAGYQETNESIFKFLLDRVQTNLHVILCMSPIGDSFRHRVRQYPALVNGTTIDWFDRWPKQALLEVANRWLNDVLLDDRSPVLQEEMKEKCAAMFATIHFSVTDYCTIMAEEMKRHNYVTPINYLELVAGYKKLLAEKRKAFGESASRLRNGMSKIVDTRAKVQDMTIEMESAQRRVIEYQEVCDLKLDEIKKQKQETDVQAVIVSRRREQVEVEEVECKEMARIAYAELADALPALEEANNALMSLNKKDLSEVKSYANPPPLVAKVMEAVMVLKGVDPTWGEAKKQLGNADFLKELQEFDKDNISSKTLGKLVKYMNYKDFIPDIVGKVSTAAKTLCIWVRAMELYGRIYNAQVAPKRAKLLEAEALLAEKQRILAEQEAKIRALEEKLAELQREYQEKMDLKNELEKKAELLKKKLERAAMLVEGLAGEKIRWERTIRVLDEKLSFVVGDCLLASACVSYIGPFLSDYREAMIGEWIKEIHALQVPSAADYTFCDFLSNPTHVREWNIQGLPRDSFSTENGVIVTRGRRTPLMIDPQCQALKWIKNMEGGRGLKIIDLRQPDYLTILENCMTTGTPVLLKDVGEELDPTLAPALSRTFFKSGEGYMMKLGDKEIDYNIDFRLYITTKMSNPHYVPEIASRACIVNFAVKEQGLEAQLLGIVVRKEKPELEQMKDNLVINIASGKKKLEELEDLILKLLNESSGSILEDEELANTLKVSKETSDSVTIQLQNSTETEIEIDSARENYRPCAKRSSVLFFVLNDMSHVDPMYQFSLDSYINLFNWSIEKSPTSNRLDDRIHHLNEFHTYAVYRNTCRGLFEKHKLLFSFHMCVKILEYSGKLVSEEYQYFLKGGVVLDRSEQMDNPCKAWLNEVAWDNITELDKLPAFRGIVSSFEQNPKEWYAWYTSAEPEKLSLHGDWDHKLNDFQKMIVVRALRSDRVSFQTSTFVAVNMGIKFTEPPVLDMLQVLEDSRMDTPLIFVLSAGADPGAALFTLAEQMKMMSKFFSLSLGQGQAPIATKMIETGAKSGNWVFLANCHLSLSWMPQLDKLLENIIEDVPHKDFRLWLSSSPHPEFPLSILQAGIKMTTEPPKGIKANMKRLYQNTPDARFDNLMKPEKYKKLLFCLCYFHAILLERKKFQQLGWNIVYGFNDSDFEVSELLLGIYLQEYEDTPWDALKYLIAGVMYGGHVTDDWDRRLLMSYINQYFCDDALQVPFFKLSSLPTYSIPKDGDLKHYRDVINKYPTADHPEAFGQHTNADIASQINEANLLFSTLLSLQVQKSAATNETKPEEKVSQMAAEVMAKLPDQFDEPELRRLLGETLSQPLNIVLLQEIGRYNILLSNIKRSLIELDKGIEGLVVMSAELEEIFKCIFDGKVPTAWLKAYPSLKPLGSWSRDLSRRVEQLNVWRETLKPPVKFWLSGFTFPTGFLTAVLQTVARRYSISIDTLAWEFTVSTVDAANIMASPKDGVFVEGLFLEGASWDKKNGYLIESAPMQLVTPMPVIHFKPVENKKKYHRSVYDAPCYLYPDRAGGQGRASFVVAVELRSGQEAPDHWIQRGVALLMSLAT